jgi:hypothetical protein
MQEKWGPLPPSKSEIDEQKRQRAIAAAEAAQRSHEHELRHLAGNEGDLTAQMQKDEKKRAKRRRQKERKRQQQLEQQGEHVVVGNDFPFAVNCVVWCGVVWCGVVWCGVVWGCAGAGCTGRS